MAVVLRYVKHGSIIESFFGIIHVSDTTSLSLKKAIEALFSKHNLSLSRLRGQGYDGTNNMQGEFNGLKALILKENPQAFYIHCFAHQLQLALVAVAKRNESIIELFTLVSNVTNMVVSSCKHNYILQTHHLSKIIQAIESGEISSGKGLNQESSLKRAGDTRWGSHYYSLISLISKFDSVVDVLDIIVADAKSKGDQKVEARTLLAAIQTFDFAFSLHLMRNVLGITNDLSKALQRKDQDIVNAMTLVKIAKNRLRSMRDDAGFYSLLHIVSSFCGVHNIPMPNLEDAYFIPGRSRRIMQKKTNITNLHHFKNEVFFDVLEFQLRELDDRFNETNTNLLLCVSCLNPSNLFSAFDKSNLIRYAEFYPNEFSESQLVELDDQLENYILDMRSNPHFLKLEGISDLAKKMVKMRKDILFPLVYKLVNLALILPVATATVERAFSAMKIVKNRLRNKMSNEWMSDNLVTYIEKDVFSNIDNETIMHRFQNMGPRRGDL